ncbi:MAG: hypothetical protein M1814_004556 [Vezdaea aestivalis]|nr:MAG: hypothetical protein M1814_004556 [Vezdaea aestivalis]
MPKSAEKSQLKRGRVSRSPILDNALLTAEKASAGEAAEDSKKRRRSQRIQSQTEGTPLSNQTHLPSPLTHKDSTATEELARHVDTPPTAPSAFTRDITPYSGPSAGVGSPPSDTQPLSQFIYPVQSLSYEVKDEKAEGVWGYLLPMTTGVGDLLVLKKRTSCPLPSPNQNVGRSTSRRANGAARTEQYTEEEKQYETTKEKGTTSGGYLIGRHPECDRLIDVITVSNRHCLIFPEISHGDTVAEVEDLSANGTKINGVPLGRNKRRELQDGDEIEVAEGHSFMFRYPESQKATKFSQQYTLLERLGKGHFATVHLCLEKSTGQRYAVKIFTKRPGVEERSKTEGLQQEIAVLMGVSHPNVLCLKDTFDEEDGVYLVLELAAEGELFNWIILKSKLSEADARKLFIQLFQGIKYLHERNIVHRDIKPENILLVDKNLTAKLADFGLAKIIGEESFTTTLCGTPSYVAPEILQNSRHRKYTRAVDVWSLGVVLYICLCGFPPFSDELYTAEAPYNLSQQIAMGRFDYPSPYWDTVGDPALELIDRMLTVNPEQRITIDECLQHRWITQLGIGPADSTDGLTGAMGQLDFSKRKVNRERTLLSAINDVQVNKVINLQAPKPPVKIYTKNDPKGGKGVKATPKTKKEETPSAHRTPGEFMGMGGKGDEPLFGEDSNSKYP